MFEILGKMRRNISGIFNFGENEKEYKRDCEKQKATQFFFRDDIKKKSILRLFFS